MLQRFLDQSQRRATHERRISSEMMMRIYSECEDGIRAGKQYCSHAEVQILISKLDDYGLYYRDLGDGGGKNWCGYCVSFAAILGDNIYDYNKDSLKDMVAAVMSKNKDFPENNLDIGHVGQLIREGGLVPYMINFTEYMDNPECFRDQNVIVILNNFHYTLVRSKSSNSDMMGFIKWCESAGQHETRFKWELYKYIEGHKSSSSNV
jgi:hypothetical protein